MFLRLRFDFVVNANQPVGLYQMRFAGLFDCKNLKAHGEAILIYKESSTDVNNNDIMYSASSTSKDAVYEEFVKERLPILGPLNYAPYLNNTNEHRDGYVPITKLASFEDNKLPAGKSFLIFK